MQARVRRSNLLPHLMVSTTALLLACEATTPLPRTVRSTIDGAAPAVVLWCDTDMQTASIADDGRAVVAHLRRHLRRVFGQGATADLDPPDAPHHSNRRRKADRNDARSAGAWSPLGSLAGRGQHRVVCDRNDR